MRINNVLSYPPQACWRWSQQCCSSATLSLRKRETPTRPPCLRTQVNTQHPVKTIASVSHDSWIYKMRWVSPLSFHHNRCGNQIHVIHSQKIFPLTVSTCFIRHVITRKWDGIGMLVMCESILQICWQAIYQSVTTIRCPYSLDYTPVTYDSV